MLIILMTEKEIAVARLAGFIGKNFTS